MRICVFWDVENVSSAGMGPYPFWGCTIASSWKRIVDTEKVITSPWNQCIPSKLHEPLTQEYGVTSQKTVIFNYLVKVLPHNRSLQPLFLAPNQLVAAFHYSTYFLSLSLQWFLLRSPYNLQVRTFEASFQTATSSRRGMRASVDLSPLSSSVCMSSTCHHPRNTSSWPSTRTTRQS